MPLYFLNKLISIFSGIIFRGDNQTSTFPRPPIHCLNDVNHFLFVFQSPVYLVVVSSAQIYHDVLIPKEEHHCTWIVQLIPVKKYLYIVSLYHSF